MEVWDSLYILSMVGGDPMQVWTIQTPDLVCGINTIPTQLSWLLHTSVIHQHLFWLCFCCVEGCIWL